MAGPGQDEIGGFTLKMTGITPKGEGRYRVCLDNGKSIVILADILDDLDDMIVFETMLPTGWIVSGTGGGILGDSVEVVIDPLVRTTCGSIDDMYATADDIRASGDYVTVTADAMHEIMRMLKATDQE